MSTSGVTDIRLYLGFCDHRKTKRMVQRLGEQSVRCLLRLFLWTASHRPLGVLHDMSTQDIADEAGWDHIENPQKFAQNPDQFVEALASEEIGYLDRRQDGSFQIHQWEEYQTWVSGAPERKTKSKKANAAKYGKNYDNQPQLTFEPESIPAAKSIPQVSIPQTPSIPAPVVKIEDSSTPVLGPPPPPPPLPNPIPVPQPPPPPRAVGASGPAHSREKPLVSVGSVLNPPRVWKTFVRALRFDLGWIEHEAEALMRAQRLKSEEPYHTDNDVIWPLANAMCANELKAEGKLRANVYAYVSGCSKEPQDRYLERARELMEFAMAGTQKAGA